MVDYSIQKVPKYSKKNEHCFKADDGSPSMSHSLTYDVPPSSDDESNYSRCSWESVLVPLTLDNLLHIRNIAFVNFGSGTG